MHTEEEVKFSVTPADIDDITRFFATQRVDSRRYLEEHSDYYDSNNLILHRFSSTLRLRLRPGSTARFEQVFKSSHGMQKRSPGVLTRSEWSWTVGSAQIDFRVLHHLADTECTMHFLSSIRPNCLARLFRINLSRDLLKISVGHGFEAVVAIDRGTIAIEGYEWPIYEVELELVSGSVDGLLEFAEEIKKRFSIEMHTRSKAELGYLLFSRLATEPGT